MDRGDASLTVGQAYAPPPPEAGPWEPPPARALPVASDDLEPETRRSPVRFTLGPVGITTGKSMGVGVAVGLDIGTGSVGGRLGAAWLRGEGTTRPTGDAVGLYEGELTLDLRKRGPLHPVLGMGVGLLHVSRADRGGFAGVGTARAGLEYALGLDDADVRLGANVGGGLVGAADRELDDLRAYALVGGHVTVGF